MGKISTPRMLASNIFIFSSLVGLESCGHSCFEGLNIIKYPLLSIKVYVLAIVTLNLLGSCIVGNKPEKVSNIISSSIFIFLSTVVFHIIAVLFGAPFLSSVSETYHFACLVCATTIVPSFLAMGPNQEDWIQVYAQHNPLIGLETNAWITTLCSVTGAWLGAVPIPLDWDRPWQVWPVTCSLGTIYGYMLGLIIASVYAYIQNRNIDKSKLL